MITTPAKYVRTDILIACGFNYDEPSTVRNIQDHSCRVFVSELRNDYQLIIIAATKQESISWYFRKILDISQEDGVGIQEERLKEVLEEMISPTYEINPNTLTGILLEAVR